MLVDDAITLLAAVPQLQGRIEGGLEYAALVNDGKLPQAPVAGFVMSLGFTAKPDARASGAFRQLVEEVIGIVLVVQKPDDPSGTRARHAVEALVEGVVDAVAGQQPPSAHDLFTLSRGRLVRLSGGVAFYQVDVKASRYITRTQ